MDSERDSRLFARLFVCDLSLFILIIYIFYFFLFGRAEINKQLIRLARASDILVACDDVYNLLYYSVGKSEESSGAYPPKRLFAYDIEDIGTDDWQGNVISNGSFSKILSPGIRLGWMECPPRCLEVFRARFVIIL